MIFAGDLLAQSIASSYGIMDLEIPVYGLYGACSTMGEALSLAAMTVAAGYGEYVLALTSVCDTEEGFRRNMAVSVRCLPPGLLQAAVPAFWGEREVMRRSLVSPRGKLWIMA